ncbi:DsbC family protein [Acinetobacter sp. ANC 3791]|uniref:DsbC family protein n=1 Tax=Acinetobacter sp. ANC 3791 TaxID=2529836 RepID=UPI00103E75C7|nr:DsbC family protein [Acinetobacter sp. ANC 3791]TCB86615.1 DsbC family protein [Acinetobacter sp. ANC 3791]
MKKLLAALGLSLMTIGMAHADIATLKANLQKNYPDVIPESIQPTPIKDIYEVYMDGEIVYTNDEGRYFFIGNLVDLKNQVNLTEQRQQELTKIDIKTLPLNQAIKHVKGNGKRVLYIFSDPDCPYCHALEEELKQVDNVTVYLFLYPLTNLHPNAEAMAQKIWCSKDKYAAWEGYVLDRKQPGDKASCATPIQKNLELGKKLRIDGTPTFFLKDGQRISGARSADDINKLLDSVQ